MKHSKTDTHTKFDYSAENFPCGALVTNSSRIITYVNAYFTTDLLCEPGELIGKNADVIFTKASRIFFQSYLIPTLLHEKVCEEMQLIIFNAAGARIPITVNARIDDNGCIYWSFFNATKRDELYEELIKTREELEVQAEQLKSLASTDYLTGLLNRREMKYRSVLALELAGRSHRPIGLLMIDIDNFKSINDSFGHPAGDKVLKAFAKIMHSRLRETDVYGRFGGEEFFIIFPNQLSENALNSVNAILERFRTQSFVSQTGQLFNATFSAGITEINAKDKDISELVSRVDNALYSAKAQGKNKLIAA
jgi:diguanylate cyclase (GGDEF)-like protein